MLDGLLAFVFFFVVSAGFVRAMAWNWPWHLTMPFSGQYDANGIYNHIKGRVFNRTWFFSTLLGASMITAGSVSGSDYVAVYSILGAVSLVGFVSGTITYKLFYVAIDELGLAFPPTDSDPH